MGEYSRSDQAIFQVKITLKGVSTPPVWRRVLVPAGIRLHRFHDVIQAVVGWSDYHMHVFSAEAAQFGFWDAELGHRDERRATLDAVLEVPGDRLIYTDDFGDDWDHEILLEGVMSPAPGEVYPRCSDGKGACPPEDCGGAWGYMSLREVLANPNADEHDEMLEWLGLSSASEFDPAVFDLDAVNEALGVAVAAH
jgi:hypothetical protein